MYKTQQLKWPRKLPLLLEDVEAAVETAQNLLSEVTPSEVEEYANIVQEQAEEVLNEFQVLQNMEQAVEENGSG
jgi:hypothetical protein